MNNTKSSVEESDKKFEKKLREGIISLLNYAHKKGFTGDNIPDKTFVLKIHEEITRAYFSTRQEAIAENDKEWKEKIEGKMRNNITPLITETEGAYRPTSEEIMEEEVHNQALQSLLDK
jgi:hypothetical protein